MASLVLAAVKLRPPKHPMLIKLFQSPLLVDVTFFYLPQYFYFASLSFQITEVFDPHLGSLDDLLQCHNCAIGTVCLHSECLLLADAMFYYSNSIN